MKQQKKKAESQAVPAPSSKYPRAVVQEALQLTFVLRGHIKRAQQYYLVVGRELAEIQEKKLYLPLKHPDLFDLAKEHLGLSQASVYRYLRIHNWVKQNHPEWLKPGWKGTIPDLSDMPIVIGIDQQLERKDLKPEERRKLETAKKKAGEGTLESGELRSAAGKGRNTAKAGLTAFLSTLRRDRTRGIKMANMPGEVIAHLDEAIAALENAMDLQRADVAMGASGRMEKWPQTRVA